MDRGKGQQDHKNVQTAELESCCFSKWRGSSILDRRELEIVMSTQTCTVTATVAAVMLMKALGR